MIITQYVKKISFSQVVKGIVVSLEHPGGKDLDHVDAVLRLAVDGFEVHAIQEEDEEAIDQEQHNSKDQLSLLVTVNSVLVLWLVYVVIELLDLVASLLQAVVDACVVGKEDVR